MANEVRLIDANALKERAIRVSTVKEHCYMKAVGTREIDNAPTVDAVEVTAQEIQFLIDAMYRHIRWMIAGGLDKPECSFDERVALLLLLRRQGKKNKPWEVQDGQNLLLPLLPVGRGAERAL